MGYVGGHGDNWVHQENTKVLLIMDSGLRRERLKAPCGAAAQCWVVAQECRARGTVWFGLLLRT